MAFGFPQIGEDQVITSLLNSFYEVTAGLPNQGTGRGGSWHFVADIDDDSPGTAINTTESAAIAKFTKGPDSSPTTIWRFKTPRNTIESTPLPEESNEGDLGTIAPQFREMARIADQRTKLESEVQSSPENREIRARLELVTRRLEELLAFQNVLEREALTEIVEEAIRSREVLADIRARRIR